jgi:dTDP-4-amino-4,6-dideoxygalactose transaminase
MEFYGFNKRHQEIKKQLLEAVASVIDHGQFILGPEVPTLEANLSAETDAGFAVGFGSGTDALIAALLAAKVGPHDIVMVPAFTFNSTAEVVRLLGAHPHFVDIDPLTLTMDPERLQECLIDHVSDINKVKAVIPVDLFGNVADYRHIDGVLEGISNCLIIADAAQSLGSTYHGNKVGSLADITCTSFFPTKPLGGFGDAGMCFTSDDELAAVLYSVRNHGEGFDKYDQIRLGFNGRMDTIQAALLLEKGHYSLGYERRSRIEIAERYDSEIFYKNRGFRPQMVGDGCKSCYSQYSIIAKNESSRERLQKLLEEEGVPTMRYYPTPLPLQPFFQKDRRYGDDWEESDFPNAVKIAKTIFQIPINPYLEEKEIDKIIQVLDNVND